MNHIYNYTFMKYSLYLHNISTKNYTYIKTSLNYNAQVPVRETNYCHRDNIDGKHE